MRHKGTGLRRDYLKLTSITPDQTEKILKTRLSLDVVFHTNPFIKQFDSFILQREVTSLIVVFICQSIYIYTHVVHILHNFAVFFFLVTLIFCLILYRCGLPLKFLCQVPRQAAVSRHLLWPLMLSKASICVNTRPYPNLGNTYYCYQEI